MILAHNLSAMNAQRQLGMVSTGKAKTTEKLSSGYRINRAADDAAGLSISEKMRAQIRGLNQGAENCQDGVSMCQVADGALTEVNDMLHRMTELTIQAANGTNSESDRNAIQQEINQIRDEINRIGETTEFNTRPLFKGRIDVENGGEASDSSKPTVKSKFFSLFGDISKTCYMQEPLTKADVTKNTQKNDMPGGNPYVSVHIDMGTLKGADTRALIDSSFYVNCCTNCCPSVIKFVDDTGIKKDTDGTILVGVKKDSTNYFAKDESFCEYLVDKLPDIPHVEFGYKGSKLYIFDTDNKAWSQYEKESAYFCDAKTPDFVPGKTPVKKHSTDDIIRIQAGPAVEDGIFLHFQEMNSTVLGLDPVNVTSEDSATRSIDTVGKATRIINAFRSKIGAQTNRLEHAIAIDKNTEENTQAAESRIRDTDMAKEMVRLSMANILEQAGQSMLAQANQSTQSVLQLLQ